MIVEPLMDTIPNSESEIPEQSNPPGIHPSQVDGAAHTVTLRLSPELPEELPAGQAFTVAVSATCSSGCDLRGSVVSIPGAAAAALDRFDAGTNSTSDLPLTAPTRAGVIHWTVTFRAAERVSDSHGDAVLPVTLRTIPHETSLAVWGVPSAVVVDRSFPLSVGVKCVCGCNLHGHVVEIVDGQGTVKGEAVMGDVAWPGTEALWWSTARVTAPAGEGVYSWTCRLAADEVLPPHDLATGTFSFRTARPPEHSVLVEVSDIERGLPLDGVEVRVGPYVGFTDASGTAILDVPAGAYEVSMRKEGFAADARVVDVDQTVTVSVQAHDAPTRAIAESPVGPHHPYRD
jgi:hypothetical protein